MPSLRSPRSARAWSQVRPSPVTPCLSPSKEACQTYCLIVGFVTVMKRVLITGMSGTGKSSVIQELLARGYRAYDLDTPEWSEWIDAETSDTLTPAAGKDWVWREDRVRALLSRPHDDTVFIAGCAENMGRLLPLIDAVVLLSAPLDTIMQRLRTRSLGGYGATEKERRKVEALTATIEPLLRQSADHEIDTRQPVRATVEEILRRV
jgi:shikimate kinase